MPLTRTPDQEGISSLSLGLNLIFEFRREPPQALRLPRPLSGKPRLPFGMSAPAQTTRAGWLGDPLWGFWEYWLEIPQPGGWLNTFDNHLGLSTCSLAFCLPQRTDTPWFISSTEHSSPLPHARPAPRPDFLLSTDATFLLVV